VGDPVVLPVSQVHLLNPLVLRPVHVMLPASQVSGFAGAPVSQVLPVE
jgi:hypothetical protein